MFPEKNESFIFRSEGSYSKLYSVADYLVIRDLPWYIYINDLDQPDRDAFVSAVFGDVRKFAFQDDATYPISRAEADYPILLIDVTDPARMAKYLRTHRALLRNVPTFAIMTRSSPSRRARMLMAGCDDVFDSARITPQEAGLRLRAVLVRRAMARSGNDADRDAKVGFADLADPRGLTPREHALLVALAAAEGEALSLAALMRLVDHADPAKFRRSVKVSISNLRKKLKAPYRIEAAAFGGYRLVREETAPALATA